MELRSAGYFEDGEFARGAKLTGDSFNQWKNVECWFSLRAECAALREPFFLKPLTPIEHYREYYGRVKAPELAEALIAKSDPEAMAAFDALADEFNARLNGVLEADEAMAFVGRARKIIYQRR